MSQANQTQNTPTKTSESTVTQVSIYLKNQTFGELKNLEEKLGINRQTVINTGVRRILQEYQQTGKISLS